MNSQQLWNSASFFILRKIIHLPHPLPYATCCDSPVDPNTKNSTLFLPRLVWFPCSCFVILSIFCLHSVHCYGLGLTKFREVTEKRTCGGVQMRWLLKRLGIQRPHGRRAITLTHEGVVSSVWQSSHNSGLIHHMGIMQLTGTTPKKSYTRSTPASQSLNNPIPLLSTHCLVGKRQSKWAGIID